MQSRANISKEQVQIQINAALPMLQEIICGSTLQVALQVGSIMSLGWLRAW